jgi:hypothetical protein
MGGGPLADRGERVARGGQHGGEQHPHHGTGMIA